MAESSTILFAGGGTGGHLIPGIAVAKELFRRNDSLRSVFVGSDRAIESMIATQYQLEHRNLPVESLSMLRRNPWKFVQRNWQAWGNARRLIREINPAAVIGLGGFASAPLIWEAKKHRIPIVLLEQNVIPGKTTRWLSRWADAVCVSFEETNSYLTSARKIVVTGNPVREQIAALCHQDAIKNRSESSTDSTPHLLILGGSQGAHSLNAAVVSALQKRKDLLSDWKIVHQTGAADINFVRQAYDQLKLNADVEPFFQNLQSLLPTASLVISRAGATTLAELACAGLPVILLPFPDATDHHQHANAQIFVKKQAAMMVEHAKSSDQTTSELLQVLEPLVVDSTKRHAMGLAARQLARPDAAARVANIVADLIA